MEKNKSSMSASAIFYVAFAVSVLLLTSGLVVGLPTPTIQQAQATTSPSRANEHISEQGREHQSERGAERSGVSQPVFCSEWPGFGVVCFETQGECERFREIAAGVSPTECQRFVEPPSDALFCRLGEPSPVGGTIRCNHDLPFP